MTTKVDRLGLPAHVRCHSSRGRAEHSDADQGVMRCRPEKALLELRECWQIWVPMIRKLRIWECPSAISTLPGSANKGLADAEAFFGSDSEVFCKLGSFDAKAGPSMPRDGYEGGVRRPVSGLMMVLKRGLR